MNQQKAPPLRDFPKPIQRQMEALIRVGMKRRAERLMKEAQQVAQ